MQSEATGNYPVASCSAHERYLVDAPLRGCLNGFKVFLFLVKTFLLRFGIVPSVGYIVGDIVVYFTDFVLQLTLLFIILSWAEDSSSSHEIDSVEYR